MRWLPGALAAELSPPVHGPIINPRFSRGMLSFLDIASGRDLLNPSPSTTITGTRVGAFRTGTARGFGSTDGVGSTDSVRFGSTTQHSGVGSGGAVSFACRVVIRGAGGGGFGRILHKGQPAQTSGSLQCFHSTATYNPGVTLSVIDTGSANVIDRTWPIPAFGTPMSMVFTVRGGGSGQGSLWINGDLVATFSAASTGGGSGSSAVDNWFVGNRGDGLRNLDGVIGHVPIWNRELAAGEAQAISADFDLLYASGTRPLWAPSATGATVYRPGSDLIVNGWTAVGAGSLAAAMADASNATYAESPNLTDPATETWDAPLPAGTYDISVTFDRTATNGQLRLILLDSGGGTVGTSAWQAAPAIFATTVFNVTTTGTSDRFRIEVQP